MCMSRCTYGSNNHAFRTPCKRICWIPKEMASCGPRLGHAAWATLGYVFKGLGHVNWATISGVWATLGHGSQTGSKKCGPRWATFGPRWLLQALASGLDTSNTMPSFHMCLDVMLLLAARGDGHTGKLVTQVEESFNKSGFASCSKEAA